ncbi:MAG: membrane dipeptidase [Polyangiaceae bacterium]|nr:membrane dipeptidase [Polyangiaceae bacterium]
MNSTPNHRRFTWMIVPALLATSACHPSSSATPLLSPLPPSYNGVNSAVVYPYLLDYSTWTVEGSTPQDVISSRIPNIGELPGRLRPSLGGNYWSLPIRMGNNSDINSTHKYLSTERVAGRVEVRSQPFGFSHRYVSFLVGAGGHKDTWVELRVKRANESTFTPVYIEHGPGVLGMRRVVWDTGPVAPKASPVTSNTDSAAPSNPDHAPESTSPSNPPSETPTSSIARRDAPSRPAKTEAEAQIVVIDNAPSTDLTDESKPYIWVDDVQVYNVAPPAANPPQLGFADLHVHLFNQLGFGGKILHGCVYPPTESTAQNPAPHCPLQQGSCKQDEGAENCHLRLAMPSCAESHGTLFGGSSSTLDANPKHTVDGYPTFDGFPTFHDVAHQKMYIDWLKRAYDGGLRLIQLDVGNSEALGSAFLANTERHSPALPIDDDLVIDLQLDAAWQFVRGPAKDWADIATTPAEARRIIASGKMAIVLGVETDTFGGFSSPERIQAMLRDDPTVFQTALKKLYDRGVRHLVPIHLTDNAFGGAAVFVRKFHSVTKRVAGQPFKLQNGFLSSGVRYRLDKDIDGETWILEKFVGGFSVPMDPYEERSPLGLAHVNREGLSPWGKIIIQEMLKLGMLLDVDHMSDASVNETIALAERVNAPVMASHGGARALAFGSLSTRTFNPDDDGLLKSDYHTKKTGRLASERIRSDSQIQKIAALGGIVGVGMDTGSYSPEVRNALLKTYPNDAKIAPDCDGSSVSFAETVHHINRIMNGRGIAFGTDVNGFAGMLGPRFGGRACSVGNSGDDLRKHLIPIEAARQENGVVYNWAIAKSPKEPLLGHWDSNDVYTGDQLTVWKNIANAFVLRPTSGPFDGGNANGKPANGCPDGSQDLFCQMLSMWNRAHGGNNPPLQPSIAGQRIFDVNIDGVAHYGMIPDALQDMKNIGTHTRDLQTLLYSAHDYITMWERAEEARIRALTEFAPTRGCKMPCGLSQ